MWGAKKNPTNQDHTFLQLWKGIVGGIGWEFQLVLMTLVGSIARGEKSSHSWRETCKGPLQFGVIPGWGEQSHIEWRKVMSWSIRALEHWNIRERKEQRLAHCLVRG